MKKGLFLLLIVVFSFQLFAYDQFNTYRWNRKNALNGSTKYKEGPWYEWWYYKVVLPKSNEAFYFVYGVVNPWDKNGKMKGSRSYVGMGDFFSKINFEEKSEVEDFEASYKSTYVYVNGNVATDRSLRGDIVSENGLRYKWDIEVEKKWSYNGMGWGLGMGITNIDWYPAQASARCTGTVEAPNRIVTFEDAPCYQDRNWGKTFPRWWAWIVSNHFEGYPDTVLAVGGGWPSILGFYTPIKGLAIGLKHRGVEYSFTPAYLDTIRMNIDFGTWEVTGINRARTQKVVVKAWAPREKFMDLQFMTPDGKVFHDYEALLGSATVKIYKNTGWVFDNWKLVETLRSNAVGIEYGSMTNFDLDKMYRQKKLLYKSNN